MLAAQRKQRHQYILFLLSTIMPLVKVSENIIYKIKCTCRVSVDSKSKRSSIIQIHWLRIVTRYIIDWSAFWSVKLTSTKMGSTRQPCLIKLPTFWRALLGISHKSESSTLSFSALTDDERYNHVIHFDGQGSAVRCRCLWGGSVCRG